MKKQYLIFLLILPVLTPAENIPSGDLQTKKTYLRPYLDTSLFGQWFYGIMVALNGLMNARDVSEEYYSYFEKKYDGSCKILQIYAV